MSVLRERVRKREQRGRDASDADLAVLAHQAEFAELPAGDESEFVIAVDTERGPEPERVVSDIRAV